MRGEELLTIGEQLLATDGCQKFSTQELAARLGVGKGTIYSQYSSQRELIEAVISRVAERLLVKIGDDRSGTGTSDALERTVLQIVDSIAAAPRESLGYPCCLRSLPCPYNGSRKVIEALTALIESPVSPGQEIDAGLAAYFFQSLLSAAVNHNDGGDRLHIHLTAAAQFWLRGIRR